MWKYISITAEEEYILRTEKIHRVSRFDQRTPEISSTSCIASFGFGTPPYLYKAS